MKNKINKTNLSYFFILLTLLAIVFNIAFFNSHALHAQAISPETIILSEKESATHLSNAINLTINNKFEEAINELDFVSAEDFYIFKNNNSIYSKLIKEYKKVLVSKANAFYENKEFNLALNLLNSKTKFYVNDDTINDLININKVALHNTNLVAYNGEIEHLFTHCLLAYPEKALNPKNTMSANYDKDCITPTEFKNILNALYAKNYVLIKINDVFEVKDGIAYKKQLLLPPDKKPLIWSFDDVNYDSKKANNGMVDKIILDRNGNIATYTSKISIQDRVSYNNEFVTILESFIKEHPDFSFNGARGVICLTGYDGILGYRTQKTNATSRFEIKKALQVITKLKSLGWEFASHSYGHYHMKNLNDMEFAKEVSSFENEVMPIIGKTAIYMYPYGEWDVVDENGKLSQKQELLLSAGFKLFCGVGIKNYFGYLPYNTKEKHTLIMDRKPIDGFSLRNRSYEYAHLFNTEEVYDHINRTVPFNTKEN